MQQFSQNTDVCQIVLAQIWQVFRILRERRNLSKKSRYGNVHSGGERIRRDFANGASERKIF